MTDIAEIERLRALNAEMVEVLDYYACADHYTYENGPHDQDDPVIMDDKGSIARAILAKTEGGTDG